MLDLMRGLVPTPRRSTDDKHPLALHPQRVLADLSHATRLEGHGMTFAWASDVPDDPTGSAVAEFDALATEPAEALP
jgi:hypothetical protein